MSSDFKFAVADAMQQTEVTASIEKLYIEVGKQISSRKPICDISGRCCRFEEYGHRLFVTTMEMGAFIAGLKRGQVEKYDSPPKLSVHLSQWDSTGCPFQVQKLCTVHPIRPFGCRMFFCDPSATNWQQDQYEIFHAKLKTLHQTLHIPYFYVEWRWALAECLPILQENV